MSMLEWGRKEIQLACDQIKEPEDSYFKACYKSALRAFEVLCGDDHSGMSIQITKGILNKLIDGNSLLPITDIPEEWTEVTELFDGPNHVYQCNRMSSLFKYVYPDGTVKYSDTDRVVCYDKKEPDIFFGNGGTRDIIDELYPITMPYSREGIFKVCCEEFLVDENNGDFDTLGILFVTLPDGTKVNIDQYKHEINGEMVHISKELYENLKSMVGMTQNYNEWKAKYTVK